MDVPGLSKAWFVGFYTPVGIYNVHEYAPGWEDPEEILRKA